MAQRFQRGTCPFAWLGLCADRRSHTISWRGLTVVAMAAWTLLFALPSPARAGELWQRSSQSPASGAPSSSAAASAQSERTVTSYTLPLAEYRKARDLAQIEFWGQIVSFLYSIAILFFTLRAGFGPKLRDWAERVSKSRIVQAAIFGPGIFAALAVLGIPMDAGQQWVSRRFNLSVQGWGSWAWDWTKGQFLSVLLASFLIAVLYLIMRASPRRWWFYFWLISLPISVFLVFAQPVVVDPLFHRFEPLGQKDPVLASALEAMVQHAGQNIPIERMYWMGAAEKTTELNAYVTGLGASKRIVVWDTTIAKLSTPQIVVVAGHEMGHYVLNHIWKGMAVSFVGLFVMFYVGYRLIGWLLERRGAAWGIRGVDDWASLPALMVLLTVMGFIGTPIGNGFSRYIEHQADEYGLEVTHGLIPNSPQVAAQMFQVLGEVDLSDPAPNPVDVFLFYSHPAIPDRVRFALAYNPWANGGHGEFVP
jgi:STE24 endopeptidase